MAYKTLLTVLTDNGVAGTTLAHAATLAEANEAHLDVLCLGVDRSQAGYYYAGANAMILQETIARATEEAETLAAFAREHLDARDGRWGVEAGVAQLADITRHVAARARFSDLVVVPQPYGKDRGAELEPVVEGALFEGQTPVLVVPDDADLVAQPKRIVLAWNESAEALNAVRASLPLLQAADPWSEPVRSRRHAVTISCAPRREVADRRAVQGDAAGVRYSGAPCRRRRSGPDCHGCLRAFAVPRGDPGGCHPQHAGTFARAGVHGALIVA